MTVYVYSQFRYDSDAWAKAKRIPPAQRRTHGNSGGWVHYRVDGQVRTTLPTSGDRIVFLGDVSPRVQALIAQAIEKSPDPKPVIEHLERP